MKNALSCITKQSCRRFCSWWGWRAYDYALVAFYRSLFLCVMHALRMYCPAVPSKNGCMLFLQCQVFIDALKKISLFISLVMLASVICKRLLSFFSFLHVSVFSFECLSAPSIYCILPPNNIMRRAQRKQQQQRSARRKKRKDDGNAAALEEFMACEELEE